MLDDRSYMRAYEPGVRWSLTLILVLTNAVVFGLQLVAHLAFGASADRVFGYLALQPVDIAHGWLWQLLTFQFLHAGPLHLIVNCAMLWVFGRPMEGELGTRRFAALYLGSGVVGGVFQVACSWVFPGHFGMAAVVGASAGVFGLVAAFCCLHRDQPLTALVAFILPVTLKAKYLLAISAIIALFGMLQPGDGMAHGAHMGGLVAGMAFARRFSNGFLIPEPAVPRRRTPRIRELVQAARSAGPRPKPPERPRDVPAAEFMSREVDPILDKISAHGIHSLTDHERQVLERARSRFAHK